MSARALRAVACVALVAGLAAGCGPRPPRDYPGYDLLRDGMPPPARALGSVAVSEDDYRHLLVLGEELFRSGTFGGERTVTDLVGMFQGTVEVPCSQPAPPDCYEKRRVLEFYAHAIDKLDGVEGNLYTGNGGPDGDGYTHDLVLEFPPGTRVWGFPVPERLHTGFDVEAGEPWPLGVPAVAAPPGDGDLPYLIDPGTLGAGPAPDDTKYRLGMTCAMCHYSLDVDWDGKTDLRSARPGRPTPGSRFRPEDSWPVGNQDLHIGWLLALSKNPLLAFTVFSGPVGRGTHEDAVTWVRWVRDNYERSPDLVMREVVRGMLVQPRGYADVSPNALHDTEQFPPLFTQNNWPSNYDGALVNAGDRNSSVWTTTIDFTGLIGLAGDRAASQSGALYWEPPQVYQALPAERFADMMVRYSPAVLHDPARLASLKDDILGISDGVPGILNLDAVVVMQGPPGAIPPEVLDDPINAQHDRRRDACDYGGDGCERGPMMALLGTRVRTPPAILERAGFAALKARYPGIAADELASDAVSLMLDANRSPENPSPLLVGQEARVARGYQIFREQGCADCHRGPFTTDNRIHRIADSRKGELGLPAAPSTAGWRRPRHHLGPALGTEASRATGGRPLQLFVAPNYDPATGKAIGSGGALNGFFGTKRIGYKTTMLSYLWGSAPYLHDGGVGVGLAPGAAPEGDDLQALLARPDTDKVYGMGAVLARREREPESNARANAALSLQALLLASERARVIAANREPVVPAPVAADLPRVFPEPPAERLSMTQLGVTGEGHTFYVDDQPGGETVTSLVAFLLALDRDPSRQPAAAAPQAAPAPDAGVGAVVDVDAP